jgi:dolichol kinase
MAPPLPTREIEPDVSELDALIARTEGPQWWRKVFHAFNAVVIAAAVAWAPWSDRTLLLVLGAVVALLLAGDVVRLSSPRVNATFFRAFGKLASPREATGIASSTWYAAGILAAVALFPRPEAIAGILVLGFGDPASAFVGRTVGRRPFLGGTLEGSLAFVVTAAAILALVAFPWPAVLVAALASAFAERTSWPLDDNFTVPVVCAGALFGVGLLL